MEETQSWSMGASLSPEESFDMMRDVGLSGGSQADYYLQVCAMSQGLDATADDDDDISGPDLSSYFTNHTSSGSNAAKDMMATAASPSSADYIKTESEPSQQDGDEDDSDDAATIITPIDYSEARENHWRHAGYHDDEIEPLAWAWSQHQRLIPECQKTGWSWNRTRRDPTARDVWREAYRDLKGRDAPEPPAPRPAPPPPFWMWVSGRWTLVRPRPMERRREPVEEWDWAPVPCECWHCAAHPDRGWEQVRHEPRIVFYEASRYARLGHALFQPEVGSFVFEWEIADTAQEQKRNGWKPHQEQVTLQALLPLCYQKRNKQCHPYHPPVPNTHGVELPARYRICLLTDEYTDWVKALYSDGFLLRVTMWAAMSRAAPPGTSRVHLALRAFTELDCFHRYLVNSGLSYAIFDTEYAFRRAGSAEAGGRVYWGDDGLLLGAQQQQQQNGDGAHGDGDDAAEVDRLVEGMDFPLVCYGLSHDAFAPHPPAIQKVVNTFYPLREPVFEYIHGQLDERPREHPGRRPPAGPCEVLKRNGCITKRGYEGRGLMTALNRFIALEARARGYLFDMDDEEEEEEEGEEKKMVKGKNPMAAAGMRSSFFAYVDDFGKFSLADFGVEEEGGKDGREVYPFRGYGCKEKSWTIWCDLAPPSPSSPPRSC
ncbi:hypothetical protein PG997_014357 [Apiospora hydei]|uniref:Uncharacterized protein n=1 Tax=Apiospora hydei TaxID=1337664 RepID=A0ABR1UTK2_9PEZI